MCAERAVEASAESTEEAIRRLGRLRELFQAVIDYNAPLMSQPGGERAALRRIAEANEQIQILDRELANLRD